MAWHRPWAPSAALALVLALALPAVARPDRGVHSGTIVEIRDDGRTFVVEEMVAWQGPDRPGRVRRRIAVTPRTAIHLIERTDTWAQARAAIPGWASQRIEATDLRAGDFVTVTTGDDARSRAISLQVVRPGS